MADISLDGTPCRTSGELPRVGDKAPDFRLVDGKLADATLSTFAGKTKIVSIVPSLDTSVCAASTRKFSERLSGRDDAVLLVVSADLPFAMKRFCSGEKLANAVPLSMMRGRAFAKDYGMLIVDGPFEGLTARAVVVIDRDDRVVHAQLVREIGDEPDYDAALAAAL
ncbi:MAG TPA: thiol peroxidase [Candidatus Polarisedimenticolaceae bacterium]|nr:thiol peroxidase [Candidatus Polarisedimenticolaceae bacterium]